MSDEKTVTEREAVLRERKAFERGAKAMFEMEWRTRETYDAHNNARALYPLPVRRRPYRARLSDGTKWQMYGGAPVLVGSPVPLPVDVSYWLSYAKTSCSTADDFRAIARMLDNETEEVPEGEE